MDRDEARQAARMEIAAFLADGSLVSWAYANPDQSDLGGTGTVVITDDDQKLDTFSIRDAEGTDVGGFRLSDLAHRYDDEPTFAFDTKDGYVDVTFEPGIA